MLYNQEIKVVSALNTTAISGNGTSVGSIIDTAGYQACDLVVHSNAITDGTYALTVEEGDDAGLSDAAAVNAKYFDAALSTVSLVATDDNARKSIGFVGKKRYFRVTITASGVTTGGAVGVDAVFGQPIKV